MVRPTVFAAMVALKVRNVVRPTTPTRTPATSTIVDGRTFGQFTGRPVD